MAKRILFVPFIMPTADSNIRVGHIIRSGQRAGLDYFDKNDSWITSYKEKRSVQDEGTFHDIVQLWYHNRPTYSPLLRGLGAADQIYIRGHSLPDTDGIYVPPITELQGTHAVGANSFAKQRNAVPRHGAPVNPG